ncbi:craniofacial development protein 2-like [Plakobranchus ocellatus]|uniref:Craniofacial development protein 2-like n=1 Tax=Plakobranchus ocellatus TaxID=259542 RepID=A0AAV4B8B3_9GAST|nr:craniofacial development protein 2-like [Plakobranchus ocellatus]
MVPVCGGPTELWCQLLPTAVPSRRSRPSPWLIPGSRQFWCCQLPTDVEVVTPSLRAEDVKVEKFYEEIEKAKGYLKSQDIIIIMRDFAAKVGDERVEDVGPSGIGPVNERGSSLLNGAKSMILPSQILGIKTTSGDSGLGRAPGIEVETIPKHRQNIKITARSRL